MKLKETRNRCDIEFHQKVLLTNLQNGNGSIDFNDLCLKNTMLKRGGS